MYFENVIICLQFKTKIRPFVSFVKIWQPFEIWTRVSEHPVCNINSLACDNNYQENLFNLNNVGGVGQQIPKIRLPSSSFDAPEDNLDQAWDTVCFNLNFYYT